MNPSRYSVTSIALSLLWVGWLAFLVASFVAGRTRESWWDDAKLDLRMISCLLLAVAAWWAWAATRGTHVGRAMLWLAIGMTLGFYGDSHLATRFWWPPFEEKMIGGILFYGLGHLAYVAAFWITGRQERMPGGLRWYGPILAWQLVALVAWAAVALTSEEQIGLRIPTFVYTLLVAATPGFATALCVGRRAFSWVAFGGALFLASDVLLAWRMFHGAFGGIDELTWLCYGGGEMCIVYGFILAVAPQIAENRAAPAMY